MSSTTSAGGGGRPHTGAKLLSRTSSRSSSSSAPPSPSSNASSFSVLPVQALREKWGNVIVKHYKMVFIELEVATDNMCLQLLWTLTIKTTIRIGTSQSRWLGRLIGYNASICITSPPSLGAPDVLDRLGLIFKCRTTFFVLF